MDGWMGIWKVATCVCVFVFTRRFCRYAPVRVHAQDLLSRLICTRSCNVFFIQCTQKLMFMFRRCLSSNSAGEGGPKPQKESQGSSTLLLVAITDSVRTSLAVARNKSLFQSSFTRADNRSAHSAYVEKTLKAWALALVCKTS